MRKTKLKGQLIASAMIIMGLAGTVSVTTFANETVSASETPFLMTLTPSLNAAASVELERRRRVYRNGEQDVEVISEWSFPERGTLFQNHIHVSLGNDGQVETFLTNAKGHPVPTNFNVETHKALTPFIESCQQYAENSNLQINTYKVDLKVVSNEVVSGLYTVECHPGTKAQRNGQKAETRLASYLVDERVDIETRRARGAGIFIRDRLQRFKDAYPNPTREQYFEDCKDMWRILNSDFRTPEERSTVAHTVNYCQRITDKKFSVSK